MYVIVDNSSQYFISFQIKKKKQQNKKKTKQKNHHIPENPGYIHFVI